MTLTEPRVRGRAAPDLYGTAWLNGEPYALRSGDGDIVLLDFWSSTCVECLADLRHVDNWQRLYGDSGLVVVGVHSPEYQFAQDVDHVARTLTEQGVSYRVVLDNKGTLRSSYGVQSLPTKALIDRNGVIRYVLHGRRDMLEFERALQHLLREGGYQGELPSLIGALSDLVHPPDETGIELRCGYVRGSLGNVEGFAQESLQVYHDAGARIPGRLYLDGAWWSGRESLSLPEGSGDVSCLRFVMGDGDLFLVAGSSAGTPVNVGIRVNGAVPSRETFGSDILDSAGEAALVRISSPRAYHLLRNVREGMHDIRLIPERGPIDIYQVNVLGSTDLRTIFSN